MFVIKLLLRSLKVLAAYAATAQTKLQIRLSFLGRVDQINNRSMIDRIQVAAASSAAEDRRCPQTQELKRLVGTLIAISPLLLPPLLASLQTTVQPARDMLAE